MADRSPYVARFSRTERALHWVHATAFFALLGTGLILYLPALSEAVGRRVLVKDLHVATAVAWLVAVLVIACAGDRRGLRRTLGELDGFDDDDLRWLRGRRAPQGRFNAGQKLHASLQAAFAVLWLASGTLMFFGERATFLRLPGSVAVHDIVTLAALVLVMGHLFLALVHPGTRPALRGIVRGAVRRDWASEHHAKWPAAQLSADGREAGAEPVVPTVCRNA